MNTNTFGYEMEFQPIREPMLLGVNNNGDDIYEGDIFRSNDPRDGARPPYEAVDTVGDRIILRARPDLANWFVKENFSAETRVKINRFFKRTQKGWAIV